MTPDEDSTYIFSCPACGESLEVNASMKEALIDRGCVAGIVSSVDHRLGSDVDMGSERTNLELHFDNARFDPGAFGHSDDIAGEESEGGSPHRHPIVPGPRRGTGRRSPVAE